MALSAVFSLVDGLFVSNFVGKTAYAAVNFVWPVMVVFGSVGLVFGTGGSAVVGKWLGAGDETKASRYFSMIIETALLVGLTASVLGSALIGPIVKMLGASAEMVPYCEDYGHILLAGLAVFMFQEIFQAFLVTAGKPQYGLYLMLTAGLTNVLLDALFVAVLGWGVRGAATATVIGYCIAGVLPVVYFARRNSSSLRLKPCRIEWPPVLKASTNGISEFLTNVAAGVVSTAYNIQLMRYAGPDGVAAYGTIMYVEFLFVSAFIGYNIGSAPTVSYHYGADNREELHNLFRKGMTLMGIGGLAMLLMAHLLASPLCSIFVGYDEELFQFARHAFRVYCTVYLICGFNMFASAFFTALNNGLLSGIISALRTLVFKLAVVFVLPLLLGLEGIWMAEFTAEALTLMLSLSLLFGVRRRYGY